MKPYDLSVVMPVYNEAEAIGPVLKKWMAMLDTLGIRYRIRAYNDGSKDATGKILAEVADASDGRVLAVDKANSGHGPTILRGYREAAEDSDWVFQIDSDDEMGPESFPELWAKRNDYDFLVGRRDGRRQPLARKVVSFVSRLCVRLFYGKGIWDVNTPYRLMRAEVFAPFYAQIPDDTFAPNVILSGLAARHHLRLLEIPVPQHDRTTGEVSIKKWKLLKAAARSFWQTIHFAGISRKMGWSVFILLAAVCLAVNCVTLTRSPTVWMDEVSYSDPGIRLAEGQGFTSSVWYSQNENTFFAGNVPAHPLYIAGWATLFGSDIFSIRAANLLLALVAAWLACLLGRRLSGSFAYGWLAALMMWCLPGVLFSYRSARPDMEVLILGELFLLALLSKCSVKRMVGVGLVALMMPFAGLQGAPWLVMLFLFAIALRQLLGESLALCAWVKLGVTAAIGGAIGAALLLGLYWLNDVLDIFLAATLGMQSIAASSSPLSRVLAIFWPLPWSGVFWTLLACLALVVWQSRPRRWGVAAWVLCALTPIVLNVLGKYPIYYHFMGDLMVVMLICLLLPRLRTWPVTVRGAVVSACLVLCLIGLPARTAVAMLGWEARNPRPVEAFVAQHVPEGSIVACTWQVCYAVRARTPHFYLYTIDEPPRPASIYAGKEDFWIVEEAYLKDFKANHPDFLPIACYTASGESVGPTRSFAFTIFRGQGNAPAIP